MKKEEIISFLESGALESYLLGMCSEKEAELAEQMIQKHPEVRQAYDELQAEVEQFSNQFRQTPPRQSKDDVLGQIDQFISSSREQNSTASVSHAQTKRFRISNIAAAAAVLIIGAYAAYMTVQFNSAADHNAHLVERAIELENQLISQKQTIAETQGLNAIVVTPST